MNHYLLSIIVPIYGVEAFIKDFLDSLLPQLNEKVEIIFINDGTKDNSIQILNQELKKYPQGLNFKIIHQKNQGQSSARNTGLQFSSG